MIYSRDQVRSLETKILTLINWSLKTILPIDFVEYFVSNKWENLLLQSKPNSSSNSNSHSNENENDFENSIETKTDDTNTHTNTNTNSGTIIHDDIDISLQSSVIFSTDRLDGHNQLDKHPQAKIYIRKFGVFFLDIIAQEYEFLKYSASMVGASVVIASRMALKIEPYWTNQLQSVIGYDYIQIQKCFLHLWQLYRQRFPDDCARAEQVQSIKIIQNTNNTNTNSNHNHNYNNVNNDSNNNNNNYQQ